MWWTEVFPVLYCIINHEVQSPVLALTMITALLHISIFLYFPRVWMESFAQGSRVYDSWFLDFCIPETCILYFCVVYLLFVCFCSNLLCCSWWSLFYLPTFLFAIILLEIQDNFRGFDDYLKAAAKEKEYQEEQIISYLLLEVSWGDAVLYWTFWLILVLALGCIEDAFY